MGLGKWAIPACVASLWALGPGLARAADTPPTPPSPPPPYETLRPPRPPPPPPRYRAELPWERRPELAWERHIEVGPDLALVEQAASKDETGVDAGVRYKTAVGFGVHATWEVHRHLRVSVYFVDSNHSIEFAPGALGLHGTIASDSVHTYVLGMRLAPTLPLSERVRLWASAGVGWSRWQFPRMSVTENANPAFLIYERADSMVQFPFGVGAAVDIIPHWLSATIDISAAVVTAQDGTAIGASQAVDSTGRKRNVGGLPRIDASIVQSLGLSLLL